MYTALEFLRAASSAPEHVLDGFDVARLAGVTSAQQGDLWQRVSEVLDAAGGREGQRLQRLERAARRGEVMGIASGKQQSPLAIDHRDRSIVNAVDRVAARYAGERDVWRRAT
jgi:hypothetical protein